MPRPDSNDPVTPLPSTEVVVPSFETLPPAEEELDAASAAEKACDDLIGRWRSGKSTPAETYLSLYPALAADDDRAFELIYCELCLRVELGQPPSLDEFCARFPRHAGRLRRQLALDRELDAIRTVAEDADPPVPEGTTVEDGFLAKDAPVDWPDLPGYSYAGVLGRGGMGVVFKAHETRLNRMVAIKRIAGAGVVGPQVATRFLAEAQAIARITHPNVVRIYSIGEHDAIPYFVMEYVGGGSLANRLDGAPRSSREAARLVAQLAQGVREAHRLGVVHRDLKPSNVLIDADGTAKVADFGLAKLDDSDHGLTRTETILGSPSYMAPEQAGGRNSEVGPAADLHALGSIFYELLTGRPPFRGETLLETLELVRTSEPVPPSSLVPKIRRDAETICLCCLAKEPKKRYPSADALLGDLERFLAGQPIQARRTGPLERAYRWARRHRDVAAPSAAFAVALLLGVAGVVWKWRDAEYHRAAAERLSAGLTLDRANDLAARGRVAESLLLMNEGLATASGRAPDLDAAIRRDLAVWLPYTHTCLRTTSTASEVIAAKLHPDGTSYLFGEISGRLRLIDIATGDDRFAPIEVGSRVVETFFSADGRCFLVLSIREARLFDTATGAPLGPPFRHAAKSFRAALRPDGRRVYTTAEVSDLLAWDPFTGATVGRYESGAVAPTGFGALAVSPDGRTLATVQSDVNRPDRPSEVQFFDAETLRPQSGALPHPSDVRFLDFSPDGTRLLTGEYDTAVRLWDVDRRALVGANFDHPRPLDRVTFAPDGMSIVTLATDNRVRVWDVTSSRTVESPQRGMVTAVDVDARGRLLTASSGAVRLWALGELPPPVGARNDLQGPTLPGWVRPRAAAGGRSVAEFTSDRRRVTAWGRQGMFQVKDVDSGRPVGPPLWHRWPITTTAAFGPDGSRLVTASRDAATVAGSVTLWDARTGRPIAPLVSSNWTHLITFRPDGRRIATAGYSGMVRVWDASDGHPVGTAMRQGAVAMSLAFTPDGRRLIVGTHTKAARPAGFRLWDAESGRPLGAFCPAGEVRAVSPDGRVLLAVAGDQASLWDVATGVRVGAAMGPGRSLAVAEFSPDGRALVTGGPDGTVRLWDARSVPSGAPLRQDAEVEKVSFSSDGRLVLSGRRDGGVQLWDVPTARPLGPLVGHRGRVIGLAFRPDARSFATLSGDGDVRAWPIPEPAPGEPAELARRFRTRTGGVWSDDTPTPSDAPSAPGPTADPVAWHDRRARDARQVGDAFAALWHLDRLAVLRPRDWVIPARRCEVLADDGRDVEADAALERVLALGPADEVLDWCLSQSADAEEAGRVDRALRLLDLVIARRPNDRRLPVQRWLIRNRLGQSPSGSYPDPGDDSEALLALGMREAEQGGWADASTLYRRAARLGPVSLLDRERQALSALAAGDRASYREAVARLVAWSEQNPEEPGLLFEVGWQCTVGPGALDDYGPWIARIREALGSVSPPPAEADVERYRTILGALLLRSGDPSGALRTFDAIKTPPSGLMGWSLAAFRRMAERRLADSSGLRPPEGALPVFVPSDTNDYLWVALQARLLADEAAGRSLVK